jgi:hypothetical protein
MRLATLSHVPFTTDGFDEDLLIGCRLAAPASKGCLSRRFTTTYRTVHRLPQGGLRLVIDQLIRLQVREGLDPQASHRFSDGMR